MRFSGSTFGLGEPTTRSAVGIAWDKPIPAKRSAESRSRTASGPDFASARRSITRLDRRRIGPAPNPIPITGTPEARAITTR